MNVRRRELPTGAAGMTVGRNSPRPFAPALEAFAARLRPQTLLAEVQAVWDDVCGAPFAGYSQPVREAGGVITVAAGDAARAQELALLRKQVVAALNARLGRDAVTDLRVQSRAATRDGAV